jgi:hypothetical protein
MDILCSIYYTVISLLQFSNSANNRNLRAIQSQNSLPLFKLGPYSDENSAYASILQLYRAVAARHHIRSMHIIFPLAYYSALR